MAASETSGRAACVACFLVYTVTVTVYLFVSHYLYTSLSHVLEMCI